jgi:hypothetical protein
LNVLFWKLIFLCHFLGLGGGFNGILDHFFCFLYYLRKQAALHLCGPQFCNGATHLMIMKITWLLWNALQRLWIAVLDNLLWWHRCLCCLLGESMLCSCWRSIPFLLCASMLVCACVDIHLYFFFLFSFSVFLFSWLCYMICSYFFIFVLLDITYPTAKLLAFKI